MALSDFFPEHYPDSYSNRIARRVQEELGVELSQETRAILRAMEEEFASAMAHLQRMVESYYLDPICVIGPPSVRRDAITCNIKVTAPGVVKDQLVSGSFRADDWPEGPTERSLREDVEAAIANIYGPPEPLYVELFSDPKYCPPPPIGVCMGENPDGTINVALTGSAPTYPNPVDLPPVPAKASDGSAEEAKKYYEASEIKIFFQGAELTDVESGAFIDGKFHPLPGTEHETPFERALRQGK